jgi:hypothetical protein
MPIEQFQSFLTWSTDMAQMHIATLLLGLAMVAGISPATPAIGSAPTVTSCGSSTLMA